MPGNSWWSGDQRVTGSLRPPLHCRTKAKEARIKGRVVRSKRRREVKNWEEEEDEEVGLAEDCRPAIRIAERGWWVHVICVFISAGELGNGQKRLETERKLRPEGE